MMLRKILLLAGVLALSACAGAVPWNPQNNAGLTNVNLEWCVDETAGPYLCEANWVDGKEKQNVALSADLKSGTVTYSATGVAAFPAFESRADVERYVAEKFADVAPGVATSIVDAIAGAVGLP